MLVEFDELTLSFEESCELARSRGTRVVYWDKVRRTTKRTRIEPSPSPERPKVEPDLSGYESDREMGSLKRTRGFWSGP
jgi:hypothetical protein